jgi:quinol monooxygenase YgiN
MSVTVIVNFQAAEAKADALRQLLEQGRDVSRKASECEGFDLYQEQNDPNSFVMVQRWTSEEAQRASFEKNIKATGHFDKVLAVSAKPFERHVYRAL